MTVTRWPYPRHAAHRGAGKLAPENTLAAMRLGYDYGYRMVEFDVKLSADGVSFLLHDDTLVHVAVAGRPIIARLPHGVPAAVGEPIALAVAPDRVYVFDAESGQRLAS